jgi:hypothetical protein
MESFSRIKMKTLKPNFFYHGGTEDTEEHGDFSLGDPDLFGIASENLSYK